MTSPLYTSLKSTALGLLTDKGQSMTLTTRTAGSYDPATGTAAITTAVETVYGAVLDYSAKDIDGTLIKRGDKRVILEASDAVPTTTDTLTIGGVVHAIIEAVPVNPGGVVVIYKVQARV